MPLTKEQIIEVQTAAEFSYRRHRREVKEREEMQKAVAERISEVKATKQPKAVPVAKNSVKKGK